MINSIFVLQIADKLSNQVLARSAHVVVIYILNFDIIIGAQSVIVENMKEALVADVKLCHPIMARSASVLMLLSCTSMSFNMSSSSVLGCSKWDCGEHEGSACSC